MQKRMDFLLFVRLVVMVSTNSSIVHQMYLIMPVSAILLLNKEAIVTRVLN
jgi:hypothetical protein